MSQTKKYPFGVNVAGHITGEFGLGEAVRGNLKAMETVNIPLRLKDLCVKWQRNNDHTFTNFSDSSTYSINYIHTNPNWVEQILENYFPGINEDYFKGHYNIGFWAWEVPEIPPDWKWALDIFDEIWTPSRFSTSAIAKAASVPVLSIPHSIFLPKPTLGRSALGISKEKFVFLFVFDFGSSFTRKNPLAVVEAFKKAFAKNDAEVSLILKCSNPHVHPNFWEKLQEEVENWSSIQVIEGHLSKEKLHALIYQCNCYVSLHRSEGFGLTLAEAMYYGKPVIATGYSGNLDFMNVGNSYLVEYNLVTTTESDENYPKGSIWAEADVDRAAYLMQYVFENQKEAMEVGSQAARDIRELFSPQAVGKTIKERIEYIIKRTDSGNLSARSSSLLEAQTQNNWLTSQLKAWQLTAKQVHKELKQSQIKLQQDRTKNKSKIKA